MKTLGEQKKDRKWDVRLKEDLDTDSKDGDVAENWVNIGVINSLKLGEMWMVW